MSKFSKFSISSITSGIFFFFTLALAVAGWLIEFVAVAYSQHKINSSDSDLSSHALSFVWWSLFFELFVIFVLAGLFVFSGPFSTLLPLSLVVITIVNQSYVLAGIVYSDVSYIDAISAGAGILAIVGFLWLFYYAWEAPAAAVETVDEEKAIENPEPEVAEPEVAPAAETIEPAPETKTA